MTTENTYPEKRDVDGSVEEHSLAPETATLLPAELAVSPQGQTHEDHTEHVSPHPHGTNAEAAPAPLDQHMPAAHEAEFSQPERVYGQEPEPDAGASGRAFPAAEETAAPPDAALPHVEESPIRPFTDFIEEFRQAEARQGSTIPQAPAPYEIADVRASIPLGESEQAASATPISAVPEPLFAEAAFEETAPSFPDMETGSPAIAGETFVAEQAMTTSIASESVPAVTETSEAAVPATRPVSPLLRPASRVRLPRYSGRHRDAAAAEKAAQRQAEGSPAGTAPATPPASALEVDPASVELPRPARRYRFDRPAVTNGAASTPPARVENEPTGPETLAKQPANGTQASEQAAAKQAIVVEGTTTEVVEHDRRRRHGSDKKEKEKEPQATVVPPTSVVALPGPSAAPGKSGTAEVVDTPPEELPPLEYSEIQAATSRRRRRRRTTSPVAPAASPAAKVSAPEPTPAPIPAAPAAIAPVAVQRNVAPPSPASPVVPAGNAYNIVSGYTVNQMNQGNELSGPFMGPDPSPARGSLTTRETRTPRESHRSSPSLYSVRPGESGLPPANLNQLTNGVVQALQAQTDRMVAELRRANQAPTNVSVSFPPFPSNERVGVFVDVANLLYSARTLRMTVDFGKLLDFLRGNRRLIRAHAYCPTSPQPGDEQMFLQAVKGLGYRITTKNYKTFSSGAKKADLDLDLCMDVVRLVDGKSVDCIVLVSGDSDFMPMLDYCSDHGVRVEVAAFDEAMSATLRQSCDLFINLSMLEEIRA